MDSPSTPSTVTPVALADRVRAAVLAPVRAFRMSYLPPMMVYFAAGAIGITAVANQFWVKQSLSLSPADLAGLAVWVGLPAVMKMVFGEMVDTVAILGSQRRAYIFIGAGLVATSLLLLAGAASGALRFASPNTLYVAASILAAVGIVLQDVVADAMTTEVVDRTHPDGTPRAVDDVNADLAMVQVLGRIFLIGGAMLTAYLAGVLATIWPYWLVFLAALVVPAVSIVGALRVKTDAPVGETPRPTDWRILGGGLAFGAAILLLGLLDVPASQEITFLVSLGVISTMLYHVTGDIDPEQRRRIFYTALIIFFFRALPNTGDGYRWFLIDRYGFNELFFGGLATLGNLLTLVVAWLLSGVISRMRITSVLLLLTLLSTVFALPGLVLVFDTWMAATERLTGLGPRSLAVIDTATQSPLVQLGMIPMLTLIAIHAPAGSRAVWFALMASFMNLALTAGDLMTKYLNLVFTVERGNYTALPQLTVWVTIIALVLPLVAILTWGRRAEGDHDPTAARRKSAAT